MRTLFTALLLLLPTLAAHAQQSDTIFRFLNLPASARASALGGNQIALNEAGVSLFQINPAYLNTAQPHQAAASYINHLADINYGLVQAAFQMPRVGMLGVGVRYVGYGDMDRINEQGETIGSFHANDLALTLGLGRSLGEKLQYGGSVDLIYSGYGSYRSTGIAFSLGGLYRTDGGRLILAATIRNAGIQLSTYDGRHEALPLDISLGAGYKLQHLPLRIELMLQQLNDWNLRTFDEHAAPNPATNLIRHVVVGGEFLLSDHVHFRLGYNPYLHQQLSTRERLDGAGLSIGLGIKVSDYQIDLSRSSYSQLGALLQLSLQTNL